MTPEGRSEIEMELLGWMMTQTEEVLAVDGLSADLFTDGFRRRAAGVVLEKLSRGGIVRPFTVFGAIKEGADGDAIGHLNDCLGRAICCVYPHQHVRALRDERQRLEMAGLCSEIADLAADGDDPVPELAGKLMDRLSGVLRESSGIRIRSSKAVSEAILEAMKEIPPCYPTGLDKLDEAMDGGLYAGKSYGFAARKKVGKTILASTLSCNLDLADVPHLFICGEMSDEEVHQRTLARLAQVYPSTFRNKEKATPAMLSRIAAASFRLSGAAKFLNAPGLTFDELKRSVAIAVCRYGIKGFILDYWQLVGGKDRNKSTAEHLDEVAQWVADYCRKHRLWSVTMAQINQEGNTRGGEGMRLAFDQVYHLQPCNDDITNPARWLEMLDTRYTAWANVGDKAASSLRINDFGPYFELT